MIESNLFKGAIKQHSPRLPVQPSDVAEQKIKDLQNQLELKDAQIIDTLRKVDEAEEQLREKKNELDSVNEQNTSMVNEYEKILSQLTQECNKQVSLNVGL